MTRQRFRLAVCKGPDCRMRGADAVYRRALELVRGHRLAERCEVVRGGCYGLCDHGANVVVRAHDPAAPRDPFSSADFQLLGTPGEAHYPAMTPQKVERVVLEHGGEGRPVTELLHRPPGAARAS